MWLDEESESEAALHDLQTYTVPKETPKGPAGLPLTSMKILLALYGKCLQFENAQMLFKVLTKSLLLHK